jgi:hypothetical protein
LMVKAGLDKEVMVFHLINEGPLINYGCVS